jgi:hypothetical protein
MVAVFGAAHLNATRTLSSIHMLPNSDVTVQSFVCVLKDSAYEAQVCEFVLLALGSF